MDGPVILTRKETDEVEMQIWTELAEAGLLVSPGWYFCANPETVAAGKGHLRLTYSFEEVCWNIDVFHCEPLADCLLFPGWED